MKNKIVLIVVALGMLISQVFVSQVCASGTTTGSTSEMSITGRILPVGNLIGNKEGAIVLPYVIGMKDMDLQKKANKNIEKAVRRIFPSGIYDLLGDCEVIYFNGNLLVFSLNFRDKALRTEISQSVHVNLSTGEVYNGIGEIGSGISWLIKDPEQLLKIIKSNPQKYLANDNTQISPSVNFEDFQQKWTCEIYDGIGEDGIKREFLSDTRYFRMTQDFLQLIFWNRPVYSIPYTDIQNLIDKDGSLWKAFISRDPSIKDKKLKNDIELSSEVFSGYLKLDWGQSKKYYDCRKFRIYKSTDPLKFPSTPLADNITGFSYIDYNPTKSTCYYYVTPAIEGGNSVMSNIQPVEYDKMVIQLNVGNSVMAIDSFNNRAIDPGFDTKPLISDNRVLVPVRAIIEILGGSVDWNPKEKKITLVLNDKKVEMWAGKKEYKNNGSIKSMDVGVMVVNERTMVPVRFAAENFGCEVDWLDVEKQVTITYDLIK